MLAGFYPVSVTTAYGSTQVKFGSTTGDGTGQTIAIVDAYDDANAAADLATFDAKVGLPAPPSFTKLFQDGTTNYPPVDPTGGWEVEESLDIEWAHAMAPGANIILVEATNNSNANLNTAVATAAALPGVSVVSMSYGGGEGSDELANDAVFKTPAGHQGVTFLASSGDDTSGGYPAFSPNVVAVGGTSLYVNPDNSYNHETWWNDALDSAGGQGLSIYEQEPSYQLGFQSTGFRSVPDISLIADPATGVWIYDSTPQGGTSGWLVIGGTSLACPATAGLVAIANQGRVQLGGTTLDGPNQTLPAIYSLPTSDYNAMSTVTDIKGTTIPTTGLGSPKAPSFVPDLAAYGMADQLVVTTEPPATVTAGVPFTVKVAAEDALGNIDTSVNGTLTVGSFTGTFVHGVGTVSVTENTVATGVRLSVTGDNLTTQTTAFNVIAAAAAQLIITTQPPSTVFVGTQFSLSIAVQDAFGNVTPILDGSSVLVNGVAGGTVSGGQAMWTGALNTPSNAALTVTVGALKVLTQVVNVSAKLPSTLAINTQPAANVTAGQVFSFSVTVEATDGSVTTSLDGLPVIANSVVGGKVKNGVATWSGALTTPSNSPLYVTIGALQGWTQAVQVSPGNASQLVLQSQPPTRLDVGQNFSVIVEAEDAYGNAATNLDGSQVAVDGVVGGTFQNSMATWSGALSNEVHGSLTVAAGGLQAKTQTVSLVAGGATQLVVTSQPPTTIAAGQTFSVNVEAEDSFGNAASDLDGTPISIGGWLGSTLTGGTGSWSGYIGAAGTYNLTVNAGPLTAATSSVTITPGAATQLIVTEPSNVTAGSPFVATVSAEDAYGNVDPTYSGPVSLTLDGGASLAGSSSGTFQNGVAVFSNLSIVTAGTGYSFEAAGSTLSGAGTAFSVSSGPATHLAVVGQPPASVDIHSPFALTVAAEDDAGNIVANATGNVSVELASGPAGGNLGGTLTLPLASGLAVFSDLSLDTRGAGYKLEADSTGLASADSLPFIARSVLAIGGANNDNVGIGFNSSTSFTVNVNGTPTTYSTSDYDEVQYTGSGSSTVVFVDQTHDYQATQSAAETTLVSDGFEFDAVGVSTLYVYGSSQSTAAVNVTGGYSGGFYVADASHGYSYVYDPSTGTYSELSGFGTQTVSGSGGTTYAYMYASSNSKTTGDAAGSTFTSATQSIQFADFPQFYAVGAADGSDSVTLDSRGGTFVGTPTFSYVSSVYNGGNYLIGAVDAANVTGVSAGSSDLAYYYSYASNSFVGDNTSNTLSGTTVDFNRHFVTQASGYKTVTVFESGSGTDTVSLSSSGGSTLTTSPTVSTLALANTTYVISTYIATTVNKNTVFTPIAADVSVSGTGGTDTATLYDGAGNNTLSAEGSAAKLTTALGSSYSVSGFGKVTAVDQSGTSDVKEVGAIDFVLTTTGNWSTG